MNLRQLDNFMKDTMAPSAAHKNLDRISHWLEKLKAEKKYETGIPAEMQALKKIESLGLVKLSDKGMGIEAELTEDGENIQKEMISRGFYLKKGKV